MQLAEASKSVWTPRAEENTIRDYNMPAVIS